MPPASGKKLVAEFLENAPGAITTVTRWAREVAEHRAWGFETPDDIVQATLLALIRNFRDGRFTDGDLRAYVRRITKNLCVTSYRRRRVRGTEVPVEEDGEVAGAIARDDPDPGRTLLLKRVLEHLDGDCRMLIDRAYAQGMSRREIAAELTISEGAVRVRLFRCLERARALVQETGGGS